MQLFAIPWTVAHQSLSVHGISQARILEWVVISFSNRYNAVCLVAQSCLTLCDPMDCSPPGSSVCGDSPGKNTGVDCHALLKGILPTQVSNPGLLHCRQILFHLSHQVQYCTIGTVLYHIYQYHMFTSVYKVSHLSVSTYINIVLCDTKHGRCYPCY